MKIGVTYPQIELNGDPEAVRSIGLAVEELGYDSLLAYDHVVGAEHAGREPELWGPYTESDPFHCPFTIFSYLAAITTHLEFVTGVIILPQRQTALVAKQCTDIDLLSGERLRLGVGSGWNYVEYQALGEDFASRGPRLAEQIELLRRYWGEPLFSFDGKFDALTRGNINLRPKRQIPIWLGGFSEPAFRRAGKLGDGFIYAGDYETCMTGRARVEHYLAENGRSGDDFGHEMVMLRAKTVAQTVETAQRWEASGGTHASVVTMRLGLETAAAHIDYIAEVKQLLG
jgi:probable F420-dependent oxidoreductase